MSHTNGNGLDLTGPGGAYVRVSDDQQDTQRQYEAIAAFEERHEVSIAPQHRFADEGWARDTAAVRPGFQRMLKLAERGDLKWIVVSERDRFGTTDADEFVHYRYLLRRWGCRLYDTTGTEWTRKDIATVITAVVEGEKSEQEQHSLSKRTLGGKVALARLGEWQGGPVRLGLDVVCFAREGGAERSKPNSALRELWRVTFEGRNRRLKVYPDGRRERYDGPNNFPVYQEERELLRVDRSKDKGKVAAVVNLFHRYATEAVSFCTLAHEVNRYGWVELHGHHVACLLEDPTYLGFYVYNRRHHGKFHRYAGNQMVLDLNYDEDTTRNDKADWIQSHRLFDPIIDRKTWEAVQGKLEGRDKRSRAPRCADQYLAGLVYCGNCGARMVAGPPRKGNRREYVCGTYHAACRHKRREGCKCLRNGVFQATLEEYVERYLEETGKRLEILTARPHRGDTDDLTDRLKEQERGAWQGFHEGIMRLTGYLAEHHPDDYNAILRDQSEDPGYSADTFVEECLACYRKVFDPSDLTTEIERLEAEHDALMERYADLPTPRAKEKAKQRFTALETRIDELKQQAEDGAGGVTALWQQVQDLQRAITDARLAMKSESGAQTLRRKAEALRGIIQRVECTFVATGQTGGGVGKANARLVAVTIHPVVGESVTLDANVLQPTSVCPLW
jgi:DNA invertase Pin-like site-specific DNA recombinase